MSANKFDAQTGAIGSKLGASKLGYNLTVVPPGKSAFPLHNHHVNEELFIVLEGTGQLRVGPDIYDIKPQDVIACPPGGPETAHQIVNNSKEDLKYLAISTVEAPEFVEYPDSGKYGVYGKRADSGNIALLARPEDALDYWDGES